MRRILALVICLSFLGTLSAQENYLNQIKPRELKKHLKILASDEYEGRETGTRGAQMAAEYIKKHFEECGLKAPVNGSYFQAVKLKKSKCSSLSFTLNGVSQEFLKDFVCSASNVQSGKLDVNEILFVGYGIGEKNYDDYANMDVSGKAIVFLAKGEPMNDTLSRITGTSKLSPWANSRNKKIDFAKSKKPALVLAYNPAVDKLSEVLKNHYREGAMVLDKGEAPSSTQVLAIGTSLMNQILASSGYKVDDIVKKINETGKTLSLTLKASLNLSVEKSEQAIQADNVLGYMEGADPKLKDELLVITAHYDHLGLTHEEKDKVNNGADDDGSGTVAVLNLASAFAKAKEEGFAPKRSILFMTVVGEEKGLLGSEWYSDFPVFSLSNTVANLNIDMIGRVDDDHKKKPNYVYVIGADKLSSDLDKISQIANKQFVNLDLDYRYNAPNDPNRFYYRSDHYNFAKHRIPIIFYFNGVHKDYHRPSDEVDKIDFDLLSKRTQLVFCTAWEILNRPYRPVVDKVNDFSER